MNSEIKTQGKLLGQIDRGVDHTNARLNNQNATMKKILKD
jgi:hypothetical protein